ncbi:PHP domain-containing protein [Desulfonema magnum]|uniref:PHP domain-containing protein n=1 Tax=Desulfonema magnum TaxID=45655 RepID=A0A975GN48_9BACT|nr:PHP domain-containing protein [Desulfonema magnum]QTA87405.1 PHP domain-containing protein [Desulfonema magnum]
MNYYKADMHIHTCLSPCAEWEMSPRGVVERSRKKQLDIIAICDHNSMENAEAAMRVGKDIGVNVLPGMEICSKEEVHILAIFENSNLARDMQEYVYAHLPGENQPEFFGSQVVANENDEVLAENQRLLIGATTLGVREIVEHTHLLGGLSIASHVDRPAFGMISQLGFIPPDLPLDGVEVSYRMSPKEARKKIPGIRDLPCVTSSDAHYPDDIGKAMTVFMMNAASFKEIRLALKGDGGRGILSAG